MAGIEETEIFKIIEEASGKEVFKHFENEFVFPDGSPGWFDLSIQPVPEGVFILSIDVTERKKAEIALRTSEEKYRLVSDNSDDWIYWVRPDGFIHYVSPACQRVTGYSPEEFISHPELIQQIVFEADQELFRNHAHIQEYDDTPHQLDFRIRTKEGEQRWISHSCNPMLGINGEYLGRRATNRNITARKQQEGKLFGGDFGFFNFFKRGPGGGGLGAGGSRLGGPPPLRGVRGGGGFLRGGFFFWVFFSPPRGGEGFFPLFYKKKLGFKI
ncbi:MAG: PAS domain-containing protein [Bacteroidales bacterium]|nr:PAS domain-containing protein [Bacteroidales bacterium]